MFQRGLPGQEDLRRPAGHALGWTGLALHHRSICPNGKSIDHEDYPRKLAWFDALAGAPGERKRRFRRIPPILCGDFNICPSALDSWDEERTRGLASSTRKRNGRGCSACSALGDWSTSVSQRGTPTLQAFSWWDYRGGAFHRKQGLRIDFLLGNAAVVERLEAVEIDREFRKKQQGLTASDHAPVWADLA